MAVGLICWTFACVLIWVLPVLLSSSSCAYASIPPFALIHLILLLLLFPQSIVAFA